MAKQNGKKHSPTHRRQAGMVDVVVRLYRDATSGGWEDYWYFEKRMRVPGGALLAIRWSYEGGLAHVQEVRFDMTGGGLLVLLVDDDDVALGQFPGTNGWVLHREELFLADERIQPFISPSLAEPVRQGSPRSRPRRRR